MVDLKLPPRAVPDQISGLPKKFMTTVIVAVVVAGLYFGQPVLMPLALAVLASFALAPLLGMLRKLHIGHVPAVLVTLTFAVVILLGIVIFMATQFARLAAQLPSYQTNLAAKIQSVVGNASANDTIARLRQAAENIARQVSGERPQPPAIDPANAPPEPVPVIIERTSMGPLELAQSLAGPLLEPLALIALVIVFVGFILLQKDDLRDRIVRLAGSGDMQRTTIALDEAATKLARYLFLQSCVNTIFGILIGGGLWLIGIPNAGLWALMAGLFRFVPYVGVPIAFLFPATLAMAVDPGWSMLIWLMLHYAILEFIAGQAVEPFLYGRSMGLSAVAVVVAAVFWTWLWGPVGLLLSTPLTMCFVVLARHVESLKFLEVMLGDKPPLTLEQSLYLRMLADDPDEAAEEAEYFLRHNTVAAYYDEVAARALILAQADVNRGALDERRQGHIRDAIKGLVSNLTDHSDDEEPPMPPPPEGWRASPVLLVAGRGPLDEAAGVLVVDMLDKYGIGARLVSAEDTSAANIGDLDATGVRLVCVSYLEPGTFKNARYQVRRLRKFIPGVPVIALFWGLSDDNSRYLDSIEATECDIVTTGLKETLRHILAFARRADSVARTQQSAAQ
ncbi:MAG TPA: AI-2E family transporter [Rhizomicrobium sp.]|nr:AI-2E family transporter [Rhizomicrobium sp.]